MKVFRGKSVNITDGFMKEEQAGLITECVQGDEAAIAQFIGAYQHNVFRLALSVLNDPDEANEVAQDTFVAALRALKFYRKTSSLKAWLYTIALNISRSRLRKRKTIERLQSTLTTIFQIQSQNSPSPEAAVIENEEDAVLWKTLQKLGEKQRIPIVLRYYHDLSVAEIAQILNVKEGTVHSRLSIGRERLRAVLDNKDLENENG